MTTVERSAAGQLSAVPRTVLEGLTAGRCRVAEYRLDPYVREGLLAFDRLSALPVVHDVAFVILKPEAVAGRRCAVVLDALDEHGWHPLAATTFRFCPMLTREIWRYQFNVASPQRIAVIDPVLESADSILVLLADRTRRHGLPATVRLTSMKGAAEISGASSGDLRSRVGRVNGLFNFMHTADDPLDMIRQLQLLSYQTGWNWCAGALVRPALADPRHRRAATDHLAGLIGDAERRVPAHDLDPARSMRRLRRRADAWGRLARVRGDRRCVEDWLDALASIALPGGSARWDVLTVLTCWIENNEPGLVPILPATSAEDWGRRC